MSAPANPKANPQQTALQEQEKKKRDETKMRFIKEVGSAINSLNSSEANTVMMGLSALLRPTATTNDVITTIFFDIFPDLALSLGTLLDLLNPMSAAMFKHFTEQRLRASAFPSLDSSSTSASTSASASTFASSSTSSFLTSSYIEMSSDWAHFLPLQETYTLRALAHALEENLLFVTCLQLLRNLSFEPGNEAYIAYSTPLLRQVVTVFMMTTEPGTPPSELSALCFDILANIGTKIEVTGKRRQLMVTGFLENCTSKDPNQPMSGKDHELMLCMKVSPDYSSETLHEYRVVCMAYLGIIQRCIMQGQDRKILLRGIELFHKLTADFVKVDNNFLLNNCPDSLIETLASLLCVSNTSLETISMHSTPPTYTANPFPANSLKISAGNTYAASLTVPACMGPFYPDLVDSELCGLALELISSLCERNHVMQVRFARVPGFALALLKLVESRVDKVSRTDERSRRAVTLLKDFSRNSESLSVMMSLVNNCLVAGVRDEFLGDVLCSMQAELLARVHTEAALPV